MLIINVDSLLLKAAEAGSAQGTFQEQTLT